jgi:hypothetical protein
MTWLPLVVVLGLALQAPPVPAGPMRARLAPVPIDLAMQDTIAGQGTATATLSGTMLRVEGTYRGLRSPATSVRVHESALPGMRGPLVGSFESGGGTSGTFSGALTVTSDQAAAFAKGRLYVQLQTTGAPDGTLWGWLLPPKGSRP